MVSIQEAFYQLKNLLTSIYEDGEAAAISHEWLQHLTGMSRVERLLNKELQFSSAQLQQHLQAQEQLVKGVPIQYVIGSCWFMDALFQVTKQVLIPRPETEELVQWVVNDWEQQPTCSILDIGTGSGCIPISLKRKLPKAQVSSIDISKEALQVASINAQNLNTLIELIHLDFLDEATWVTLGMFDSIISNPPYIPYSEKQTIPLNVVGHEPHLALFVPDDDGLVFYRKIALFARDHLLPSGSVYLEIHQDYAPATQQLLQKYFKEVTLQKDMSGNDRMIKATGHLGE